MYKSVNIKSIVYVIDVEHVIDVVLMIVLLLLPSIGRRGSAPAQTRYIYIIYIIAPGHSHKMFFLIEFIRLYYCFKVRLYYKTALRLKGVYLHEAHA